MSWQRLVYTHYMRKLSPEEAKEKTVADVFNECQEHNRGDVSVWQNTWEGFRSVLFLHSPRVAACLVADSLLVVGKIFQHPSLSS